jgi:hypothetical protein
MKTYSGPASVRRHLSKFAIATIVVGVGLSVLAWPAEAEIIYTKVNVTIPANSSYNLDLNNDGVTDLAIQDNINPIHVPCGSSEAETLQVTPARGNGVVLAPNYAAALLKGVEIGPQSFYLYGAEMAYVNETWVLIWDVGCVKKEYSQGTWVNVSNRYLGLSFQIDGETYYGWARLSVRVGYVYIDATLTGYAYETIPGMPINVGQTK